MTPAEYEAIIHRGVPLAGDWGIRVLSAEAGVARLELPRDPRLLRPGNTVSGPAIMGFADVAMWAALLSVSEGRDESLTATMNIAFLRPCGPGPLLAEARLIKGSGRSLFGEVVVTHADDPRPCVHVTTGWVRSAVR
ncbi:PaaI family thioesterase [Sabulicella glaciei]|uniref:PaaI family thioesterase n=1 Tax=Sabulicella glaciei TaxID=2984948 RepID=A0ABT3NV96_9PROT|nr:PaaI family thioesterase [Roseococcus sp. MDT2-1-1]MCW8086074.1 PaaI family thioesterase [Roseococcus sp. MDT2-1-1]